MSRRAALLLVSFVAACGGSAAPPEPARAGHAGHPEHAGHAGHAGHPPPAHGGPLVHRFERADDWAKRFDDPARDAWQRPADVIRLMTIQAGMVVADVGAGTGYFEPWLSRAVGDAGVVHALDVEPDMVRYLRERATREKLANVKPAVVPGDDPRLPPESVDRILVVDTWHHIPAREAYGKKLRDALKPGGKVFVVDFKLDAKEGPPREHRLAPEVVERELALAGLRIEPRDVSLPEQYVVVGAR